MSPLKLLMILIMNLSIMLIEINLLLNHLEWMSILQISLRIMTLMTLY